MIPRVQEVWKFDPSPNNSFIVIFTQDWNYTETISKGCFLVLESIKINDDEALLIIHDGTKVGGCLFSKTNLACWVKV